MIFLDDRTVASAGDGGTVTLWNLATQREVGSLGSIRPGNQDSWRLAASPNGTHVALVTADGSIRVCRAPTLGECDAKAR